MLAEGSVIANRTITLVVQLATRPGSKPCAIALCALDAGASLVLIGVEHSSGATLEVGDAARERPCAGQRLNEFAGKNVDETSRPVDIRGVETPLH